MVLEGGNQLCFSQRSSDSSRTVMLMSWVLLNFMQLNLRLQFRETETREWKTGQTTAKC